MWLDLYNGTADRAVGPPLPGVPADFTDRLSLGWSAGHAPDQFGLYEKRIYDKYAQASDIVGQLTGRQLDNPVAPHIVPRGGMDARTQRQDLIAKFQASIDELRAGDPDLAMRLPDPRNFDAEITAEAKALRAKQTAAGQVSVGYGGLGDFIGSTGGALTTPLQLALLPIAAPEALTLNFARAGIAGVLARVGITAAREAAVAGGAQTAIELANLGYHAKLNTFEDTGGVAGIAERIAMTAGGAAILGGGLRSLIEAGRFVFGRLAGADRLRASDNLNTLDAALRTQESNPRGFGNAELHQANMTEALDATIHGNPAAPEASPIYSSSDRMTIERKVIQDTNAKLQAHLDSLPAEGTGTVIQEAERMAAREVIDANTARLKEIGGDMAPGATATVYTASGRPVDVQYRVVDASRLITSHDGEMRQNLAYPPELQPRDRTRAASEAQVAAIAGNLQPDRLGFGNDAATGAPIVGPDLVVESGNGRVLALRRALDENGPAAAAYREWLARQGYDLTGIKNPVLVRARMTGLSHDERIAFTQEANQSTLLKMGVSEQAASDAGRLTGLLDLYKGGQLDLAQNQEFARAFLKTLPEGERGDLTTEKGGLSQAGVDRLQAAMLHRAFGDAHLTANLMEATDTNIKAIGGALADVSGAWARMRDMAAAGEIPANMDVTADLIAAVRVVDKAREAGIPVSDMAAQGALFGDGLTDNGRALLAAMFREPGYKRPIGRAALGERLSGYADEAMKGQPGANLFGEAPSTPGQILGALDRQGNLLDQARAAITPQAAPEVTKAAETEVSRLLDAGDMQVAVGVNEVEGEKTVVYRSARELVAEADANIKAASEVSDCAIGIAA